MNTEMTLETFRALTQEEFQALMEENSPRLDTVLTKTLLQDLYTGSYTKPISNELFTMLLNIWEEDKRGGNYTYNISYISLKAIGLIGEIEALMGFTNTTETFIIPISAPQLTKFMTSSPEPLPKDSLTPEDKEFPIFEGMIMLKENSKSLNVRDNTARFSGAAWFEAIQNKIVILAGVGGIGSYTAFLLSRMQPKSLILYDDDRVESVNMSGQLYGHSNIGAFKVDAMGSILGEFSLYNSSIAIRERFTSNSEPYDIMICGFDNMEARKTFFKKWLDHVKSKDAAERYKCLYIDGRLSAEYLQVYCITGDNTGAIVDYKNTALFSDAEADETICSYKQTTYMANLIGSLIVNLFTNFVANELVRAPIRELPYLTEYDGCSMQLKIK